MSDYTKYTKDRERTKFSKQSDICFIGERYGHILI